MLVEMVGLGLAVTWAMNSSTPDAIDSIPEDEIMSELLAQINEEEPPC